MNIFHTSVVCRKIRKGLRIINDNISPTNMSRKLLHTLDKGLMKILLEFYPLWTPEVKRLTQCLGFNMLFNNIVEKKHKRPYDDIIYENRKRTSRILSGVTLISNNQKFW